MFDFSYLSIGFISFSVLICLRGCRRWESEARQFDMHIINTVFIPALMMGRVNSLARGSYRPLNRENLFSYIRENIIGRNLTLQGPFGYRKSKFSR